MLSSIAHSFVNVVMNYLISQGIAFYPSFRYCSHWTVFLIPSWREAASISFPTCLLWLRPDLTVGLKWTSWNWVTSLLGDFVVWLVISVSRTAIDGSITTLSLFAEGLFFPLWYIYNFSFPFCNYVNKALKNWRILAEKMLSAIAQKSDSCRLSTYYDVTHYHCVTWRPLLLSPQHANRETSTLRHWQGTTYDWNAAFSASIQTYASILKKKNHFELWAYYPRQCYEQMQIWFFLVIGWIMNYSLIFKTRKWKRFWRSDCFAQESHKSELYFRNGRGID